MFFFEKIIEVFIYMKEHTSEMSKSVSVYIRIHRITTTQVISRTFPSLLKVSSGPFPLSPPALGHRYSSFCPIDSFLQFSNFI